ncbi:MAG TPA: hypothetical protein VHD83_22855 [Puia sp.]|nr:hypothetical protein [Puia sp.]
MIVRTRLRASILTGTTLSFIFPPRFLSIDEVPLLAGGIYRCKG